MMITLDKLDQKAVEGLNLDALILFGSRAQGIAGKTSDYDFFVLGPKDQKTYDALYDLLSEKIRELKDIDIVFDADAPMELKNHVAKYGQVLYQRQPSVFPDFRQKVMLIYSDFAPHRAIFAAATLGRINP